MDSVAEGEAGHPKGGRRSTIRIVVYVVIINIAGRPIHFIINQVASPSLFNLKGVFLFIFFYTPQIYRDFYLPPLSGAIR